MGGFFGDAFVFPQFVERLGKVFVIRAVYRVDDVYLFRVDLYTGKTEFLKAGAAPSFVLRSGTVGKVESMSMPAGILRGRLP